MIELFKARQRGQEELIELAKKAGAQLTTEDIIRWSDGFEIGYKACKQHFEERTEEITVLRVKD